MRKIAVIAFLPVLIGACASRPPAVMHYQVDPPVQKVWPEAPETPRLRYVGELTGEHNFVRPAAGIGSMGVSALKWLVGLTSRKHVPVILQRPQGVLAGNNGRIYVSDVSRQAVYVFDEPAGKLLVWEMAQAGKRFVAPIGIAAGVDGEILVADSELGLVVRLDEQGNPRGSFGQDILKRPTGIARDSARGMVYVSDTRSHDIKVFDDAGNLLQTIGQRGEEPGQFNGPTYLSFANDKLYVADTLNARAQILSPSGEVLEVFGRRGIFMGDMPRPKGIAADKEGNIYVVESYYDYLLVFNAKGELLLPVGGSGREIGQFYLPAGVSTDDHRRIYVADGFNGRVVVLEVMGEGV